VLTAEIKELKMQIGILSLLALLVQKCKYWRHFSLPDPRVGAGCRRSRGRGEANATLHQELSWLVAPL
jgi:hypothetical protein